jgi:hypothetical protein
LAITAAGFVLFWLSEHCVVELLDAEIGNVLDVLLLAGHVDQDVDPS